jgi:hypothetical protein
MKDMIFDLDDNAGELGSLRLVVKDAGDGDMILSIDKMCSWMNGRGEPVGNDWAPNTTPPMTQEQFVKLAEQLNRAMKLMVLA